jgi:hypothetical protein
MEEETKIKGCGGNERAGENVPSLKTPQKNNTQIYIHTFLVVGTGERVLLVFVLRF